MTTLSEQYHPGLDGYPKQEWENVQSLVEKIEGRNIRTLKDLNEVLYAIFDLDAINSKYALDGPVIKGETVLTVLAIKVLAQAMVDDVLCGGREDLVTTLNEVEEMCAKSVVDREWILSGVAEELAEIIQSMKKEREERVVGEDIETAKGEIAQVVNEIK